jgi:hypothetical protein
MCISYYYMDVKPVIDVTHTTTTLLAKRPLFKFHSVLRALSRLARNCDLLPVVEVAPVVVVAAPILLPLEFLMLIRLNLPPTWNSMPS